MAKVVGIYLFDLKQGVEAENFRRFIVDEVDPPPKGPGMALTIFIGERGERLGKYLLLIKFENVAARDRYFPGKSGPSEAAKALLSPWCERFAEYVDITGIFTDYVALGE